MVKSPPDSALIPGPGRSPGEGNGYLLQYSCLENSTNRGVWWAAVHGGCQESDTAEQPTPPGRMIWVLYIQSEMASHKTLA